MVTGNLNPVIILTDGFEGRIIECLIKVGFVDHALSEGIHVLTAEGTQLNVHQQKNDNYPTQEEFAAGAVEWEKREVKQFREGDLVGYVHTPELILQLGKPNPHNPQKFLQFRYYDRNSTIPAPWQTYTVARQHTVADGWNFADSYRLVVPVPVKEEPEAEDLL
jgi:beta-glucanase (GH16 family)